MQSLSPGKILALWETGRPQHALDRALTILAAATLGTTRDALADLSIGERDARLLELRALVFGPRAEGFAECPQCTERVEFPLDTAAFSAARRNGFRSFSFCTIRPLTSRDLAEIVAAPDAASALNLLLERCGRLARLTSQSRRSGAALLEADPQAEILLHLACPACTHEWELHFDIGEFFWQEISVHAQRLLREIDALARAYGWTEREILNLSAQRRQTYLEVLAA